MTQEIINEWGSIKKKCSKCGKYVDLKYMQRKADGKFGVGGICKPCYSEYMKEWRNKTKLKDDDERHGTYYGYVLGCRCDSCKKALSDYMRKYRKGKNADKS